MLYVVTLCTHSDLSVPTDINNFASTLKRPQIGVVENDLEVVAIKGPVYHGGVRC